MKNKNKPAGSCLTILRQLCQLIPGHLVVKLAREQGIQSRSFTPWSHLVAMLYAHLSRAASLNDVCDGLAIQEGALREIRGASVPSPNGLSHSKQLAHRFKRRIDLVDATTIQWVAHCMDWAKLGRLLAVLWDSRTATANAIEPYSSLFYRNFFKFCGTATALNGE